MAIRVETCAAVHQGDRSEQQDRVSLFPHPKQPGTMLAVLADGMGGHSGGALAAEQVLLKAKQNFGDYTPATESPQEFLSNIINDAHIAIKLSRFTSEQDPHSTAVVFLLRPGFAEWAHCGDSRLYHFRHGRLVAHTQDHSLVGELVKAGRITEVQAQTHPQRNLLMSCLGAEKAPDIDASGAAALEAGDAFLLCSDGLWGYFHHTEMGRTLHELEPRAAARVLINAARQRGEGSGDNISIAIIKAVEA